MVCSARCRFSTVGDIIMPAHPADSGLDEQGTVALALGAPRLGSDRRKREGSMPITTGFNHIATLTTDIERHADFYKRVFGAEVTFQMDATAEHPRMFILDLGGGAALNVFEASAEEIIGEQRQQGGRGAIDHFGIAVESLGVLEEVKQRLIDAGADIGEIQRLGGEWSLFFHDVDGMELEVCAPADA
jgi:catechol 2,3-dioxygenase-like lactoylglutathione lyase family enzyme